MVIWPLLVIFACLCNRHLLLPYFITTLLTFSPTKAWNRKLTGGCWSSCCWLRRRLQAARLHSSPLRTSSSSCATSGNRHEWRLSNTTAAAARPRALQPAEDENPGAGPLEMPAPWPARSTPDPPHDPQEPVGSRLRGELHRLMRQLSPLAPLGRHVIYGAHKTLRTPALLWPPGRQVASLQRLCSWMTLALNPAAKDDMTEEQWRDSWQAFWGAGSEAVGSDQQ